MVYKNVKGIFTDNILTIDIGVFINTFYLFIEKELTNWQEIGDKKAAIVITHDVMRDFVLLISVYKYHNATETSKVLKTLGDDIKNRMQKIITNKDEQQEFLYRMEKFTRLFISDGKQLDPKKVIDIIENAEKIF